MPQPPAGLTVQADNYTDQYAQQFYPEQSPQRMIFQEFQQYQQQYAMPAKELFPAAGPYADPNAVQTTVMVPIVRPQAVFAPVSYNQELRGVGIKFGEHVDPQTGGIRVYVKHLVPGGPADQCQQIQPGDTLLLVNAEDVYGLPLDALRDKIPGPAGTGVRLGFKKQNGKFFEVNLARTAYGGGAGEQVPAQPMPQQQVMYVEENGPETMTIMVPRTQAVPMPVPVQQPQVVEYVTQPVQQPQVQYVVQQPQPQPQPQPQQVKQPQPQPQPQQVKYVIQQQPQVQFVPQPQQQVRYVMQQPVQTQQQVQYVMQQPQPQPQQTVQYVIQQPQPQFQQPQPQFQQFQQPQQQFQQPQPQFQQPQQQFVAAPPPQPPQFQQPQQQQPQQQPWYGQEATQV
eukprot:CAMPEP_0181345076 /NCGR_PEP_ID=MMETSP1101-20121128/32551_1 /TAXON_ID=46948 /ORGANISM="Rhodomonas abbreviata, Strain Caron Lab Isolate" /LENGTH=396 /DNA_ID=CAMNT_0023456997 /DNA_START=195 /DNA_END=1385 /DNA_ORIENTATION=+